MNCCNTKTIFLEDLDIGMSRTLTKEICTQDVHAFAELSEDRNPIHLCEETAKASVFEERIVHGMLVASLFSAVIGEQLPGHGTIYLSQNLRFTAPVKIGDTVTAEVRVLEIIPEKRRVILGCEARVGDRIVITGDATVLAPSRG